MTIQHAEIALNNINNGELLTFSHYYIYSSPFMTLFFGIRLLGK